MGNKQKQTQLRFGLRFLKAIVHYRNNRKELILEAERIMGVYASQLQPICELPELHSASTPFMERYSLFRSYLREVARAELEQIANSLEHHVVRGTRFSQSAEKNLEKAVDYFGKCIQSTYKHADSPQLAALHVVQLHCFFLYACFFLEPFLTTVADRDAPESVRLLDALHSSAIARLLYDDFQLLNVDATLSVIFSSALEQLSREPKGNKSEPLEREARLQLNPAGTGKNPEYEHEVAESKLPLPEDAPSPLELAPSAEPDPAEMVVESSSVLLAFEQLKPEEQQIVLLHAQGFTDAEVAQMLNLSIETAKKRRQRAVKKLEQALSA